MIDESGQVNAFAQTLLKLTAPGVPDIYQGTELWDFSLVDPDNRRPVDFGLRRRFQAELAALSPEQAWRRRDEGVPKLWLIQKTLGLRREHPDWFGHAATYQPLKAEGSRAQHAVAFARGNRIVSLSRHGCQCAWHTSGTTQNWPSHRERGSMYSPERKSRAALAALKTS